MKYRVIALDPGVTTGWATYTAEAIWLGGLVIDERVEYHDEQWAQGQIGPEDHHLALKQFLESQTVQQTILVCETFEFRNMDKRHRDNINLMSREYIGVARLHAEEWAQQVKYVPQTAGTAKSFIPDSGPQANKKIKDAGLWYPNQKHAMDATRHLLWYLVNRDNRMDLVRKWWKP